MGPFTMHDHLHFHARLGTEPSKQLARWSECRWEAWTSCWSWSRQVLASLSTRLDLTPWPSTMERMTTLRCHFLCLACPLALLCLGALITNGDCFRGFCACLAPYIAQIRFAQVSIFNQCVYCALGTMATSTTFDLNFTLQLRACKAAARVSGCP